MTFRGGFDDDKLDLEPELPSPREEKAAPVLIGVAVVAFIAGLVLWGSVVSSLASTTGSLFDDAAGSTPEDANATVVTADEVVLNCDDFGPQRALSAEREAAYQAQCITATPSAPPTATPDLRVNRADCATIRGTDYRSPEERQWFLANCVTN